jgi:hypothetical protein
LNGNLAVISAFCVSDGYVRAADPRIRINGYNLRGLARIASFENVFRFPLDLYRYFGYTLRGAVVTDDDIDGRIFFIAEFKLLFG